MRTGVIEGLLIMVVSPLVLSAPVVYLNPAKQPIALGDADEYWIDADAQLQPTQIISNTDIVWKTTPDCGIYPPKPGQALWIKFRVPASQDSERWVLEIPYPALGHVAMHTL